jgi:hypothetical protein
LSTIGFDSIHSFPASTSKASILSRTTQSNLEELSEKLNTLRQQIKTLTDKNKRLTEETTRLSFAKEQRIRKVTNSYEQLLDTLRSNNAKEEEQLQSYFNKLSKDIAAYTEKKSNLSMKLRQMTESQPTNLDRLKRDITKKFHLLERTYLQSEEENHEKQFQLKLPAVNERINEMLQPKIKELINSNKEKIMQMRNEQVAQLDALKVELLTKQNHDFYAFKQSNHKEMTEVLAKLGEDEEGRWQTFLRKYSNVSTVGDIDRASVIGGGATLELEEHPTLIREKSFLEAHHARSMEKEYSNYQETKDLILGNERTMLQQYLDEKQREIEVIKTTYEKHLAQTKALFHEKLEELKNSLTAKNSFEIKRFFNARKTALVDLMAAHSESIYRKLQADYLQQKQQIKEKYEKEIDDLRYSSDKKVESLQTQYEK